MLDSSLSLLLLPSKRLTDCLTSVFFFCVVFFEDANSQCLSVVSSDLRCKTFRPRFSPYFSSNFWQSAFESPPSAFPGSQDLVESSVQLTWPSSRPFARPSPLAFSSIPQPRFHSAKPTRNTTVIQSAELKGTNRLLIFSHSRSLYTPYGDLDIRTLQSHRTFIEDF